jgi:hypothetical protein
MAEEVFMATWARSQPGLLLLTGAQMASREVKVKPPPGRPDGELLAGTGYEPAPSQHWRESTPGVWGCVVVPARRGASRTQGNGTVTTR